MLVQVTHQLQCCVSNRSSKSVKQQTQASLNNPKQTHPFGKRNGYSGEAHLIHTHTDTHRQTFTHTHRHTHEVLTCSDALLISPLPVPRKTKTCRVNPTVLWRSWRPPYRLKKGQKDATTLQVGSLGLSLPGMGPGSSSGQ